MASCSSGTLSIHPLSSPQAIPILFGILAYAWPQLPQVPFLTSDVQVLCASKIYTADVNQSTAECFAYSPSTGLFTAVGSKSAVSRKFSNAKVRQLHGNMVVLPGLIDSHGHIMHVYFLFHRNAKCSMETTWQVSIYLERLPLIVHLQQLSSVDSRNTEEDKRLVR